MFKNIRPRPYSRQLAAAVLMILLVLVPAASNTARAGGLTGAEASSILTFRSIGSHDGWILESSENSNAGGTMSAGAATLLLGDDKARKQYLSILSFNTSSLPDNANITKVSLKLKRYDVVGSVNPVTAFLGFMVDIRKGSFKDPSLQLADWGVTANITLGPFTISSPGGWYTLNQTAAKTYVNKLATGNGLTQVRLRFQLNDNNNSDANILKLNSGNAGAASRPQLIVEYSTP